LASSRSKGRDRDRHGARDVEAASPIRRRIPWIAIGITLILLITAAFAADPIRDAVTGEAVGEASLVASPGYLFLTPLSTSLDAITLLGVAQHIALILWGIGVFAGIRVWLSRRRETSMKRESIAGVLFLLGLFLVYAAATLMPRPMAQLTLSDPAVLVVDFHSHTKYSHDGRAGWTEDDMRQWYHGAGIDVGYITDHATFEGAERAVSSNPGQAGESTLLLQGIEAFYKGEHVNVLSAGRRYRGLLDATLKDVDPEALALSTLIPATAPTLIETLPGNLGKVRSITRSDTSAGVVAIEVIDGSPRGLTQSRRDRHHIVALADSLNLALVTGSDNHGYGYAAAGWTLMRVPGWRGMPTDSISRRIEDVLRIGRRVSTKTIERRVAPSDPLSLLLAGPVIAWEMFATLSGDERVAWIIWVWAIVIIARGVKRMRLQPSNAA